MLLHELVETSRRVAEASGRLEKIGLLASLLRRLTPEEIEFAVAFLSATPRQGRIGIGGAALREAWPDAGAEAPTLELGEVDLAFAAIAGTSGRGSSAQRVGLLRDLLSRATRAEQEFLARLILGELRQGALEGIGVEALARAASLPASDVRRAAMRAGDLGPVARAALAEGAAGLSRFALELFRPVQPMLAQPSDGVDDAMERLGEAALEYKLDGARIQVHRAGDDVRVFSRGLRDVSAAVPELVTAARALPARELIADGEAIALRPDGSPLPFQVTMRRFGRKLDVERVRGDLPLTPFLFDLLYLDGSDVSAEPQSARFEALRQVAPALAIPHSRVATRDDAEAFLARALALGHEGIMAKAPGAPYEAGARGASWLKIKPAHTLDLVVLAAEWGHGRRRGWLSNLHLGARDPERNAFVMLGKTFKGMTDEMLKWQTQRFLELELSRDEYTVYLRPEQVVEVAFNDVQESPRYPAGLALRLARVKAHRPDKRADEADTLAAVQQIYRKTTGREPPPRRG